MKTETCKLYSRGFWILLTNTTKIDPYNFELYRFKVGSFFCDTVYVGFSISVLYVGLDWAEQCFTSPPTKYRSHERRFLQVKRPNQQYQSTEGTNSTQTTQIYNKQTWTQNTASPLFYNNMGWLGDGSHRGQGCQAGTAIGLPPRYPHTCIYFNVLFSISQYYDEAVWHLTLRTCLSVFLSISKSLIICHFCE